MKTTHIIILDNDPIVRQRLNNSIGEDPEIELMELAGLDELNAIKEQLKETQPDVILLGIDSKDSAEMRFFNYLRQHYPLLPVLVMTKHDREGAEIAVSVLKRGAVEFFPKTTILSGSILTEDFFRNRLVPVIKVAPRLNRNVLLSQHFVDTAVSTIKPISRDFFENSFSRMDLLVIAGCLGGVASLYLLLSSLPSNFPVPVIVVQHTIEIYSTVLAEDLDRYTKLSVKEADEGDELFPGHVYIAPGGYHIITNKRDNKNYIALSHGPKVAGFRPSIDTLLKSSARQFGKKALTVYLSGGGNDGIEGAKVIDIIGGQIIIQNERTSLLSDISWKVASYGMHDGSYPLERLGQEISRRLV